MLAIGALAGLEGIGLGTAQRGFAADDSVRLTWDQQRLARTRDATEAEADRLAGAARTAAILAGYPAAQVNDALATTTMSISPRATQVGKCALVIGGQYIFVLTKEYGEKRYDRQATQSLWSDGEFQLKSVSATNYSHAVSSVQAFTTATATKSGLDECCSVFGSPAPGTCCTYDLKALFECCAPCAFGGPSVYTIACVIIWCNYCAVADCTRWYTPC